MGNFTNELNNYQQIPRSLVFDTSMTDRARFVFVYMASKPDDWDFYMSNMSKELGYSQETLRKYISELINAGWLTRHEQENNHGMFGNFTYTLHAQKIEADTKNDRSGKIPHRKFSVAEKVPHIEIRESLEIDSKEEIKKEEDKSSMSKVDDLDEKADELYKLYPTKCPKRNASTGKTLKDKAKLVKLMKNKETSYEMLKFTIQTEIEERYNKQYMTNFSTFLNNLPDHGYNEEQTTCQPIGPKYVLGSNGKRYR